MNPECEHTVDGVAGNVVRVGQEQMVNGAGARRRGVSARVALILGLPWLDLKAYLPRWISCGGSLMSECVLPYQNTKQPPVANAESC